MMTGRAGGATAGVGFVLAAALGVTGARASDARLVQHAYAENEVVRIEGRAGVQATIGFGAGEAIENVAVGDSAKWQITPNKRGDLLFVKPIETLARTNMTVVTDRHTYFFDLVAGPGTKPVYLLRFTYKDAPPPPSPAPAASVEVPVPSLDTAWKRHGDADLLPEQVYDDGHATYLIWAENRAVPAILLTNAKGEEGPVNYTVRGRTIVIDSVPGTILLRSGKARASLQKPAAAPDAAAPASSSKREN